MLHKINNNLSVLINKKYVTSSHSRLTNAQLFLKSPKSPNIEIIAFVNHSIVTKWKKVKAFEKIIKKVENKNSIKKEDFLVINFQKNYLMELLLMIKMAKE